MDIMKPMRERWITDDNQQPGPGDGIPDDLGELNSAAIPPLRAYTIDEQIEMATRERDAYIERLESLLEEVAVIADEYKDEDLRSLALSWRDEFGVRQP